MRNRTTTTCSHWNLA